MKRRSFSFGVLATSLAPSIGRADKWPNGPIKFLVGFAAGGTSDVSARVVGDAVSEKLGVKVLVENRPGAGGRIASDLVARSKPDGQTFLVSSAESLFSQANDAKQPIKADRPLVPITILSSQSLVVAAHPGRGWKTLADAVATAKDGKQDLAYATPAANIGSNVIVAELIFRKAGAKVMNIPYKGGGQAVQDLLSGIVPLAVLGSAPVVPYGKAGKLTLLAVTSRERDPLLPGVPGMAESGYPNIDITQWFGVFAGAGTPKEIIERMGAVLTDALTTPKVVELLANAALSPVGGTPDDAARRFEADGERWLEAIRTLGLNPS